MTDRHQQKPYPLRIDDGLRARLEAAAKASGRSLNAEIATRLSESFDTSKQTANYDKIVEATNRFLELEARIIERLGPPGNYADRSSEILETGHDPANRPNPGTPKAHLDIPKKKGRGAK